jgi:trans-aconitate methyltransferase
VNQAAKEATYSEQDLNTYSGISDYYDVLMTNGYYNYDEITRDLVEVLGSRQRVLELGVGTGLVAEGLLQQNPKLLLTGLDNTEPMLAQAKERLDDKIRYELQDVTTLSLDRTFEAAFSVGGCWYFIDYGDRLEFCSHIDDRETCEESLRRVIEHLEPGGVLSLALQNPHTDYSKTLTDELIYSQAVHNEGEGLFTKQYTFTKQNDVVAEQFYRYLVISEQQIHDFFLELGCKPLGLNSTRKFFTYQKQSQ